MQTFVLGPIKLITNFCYSFNGVSVKFLVHFTTIYVESSIYVCFLDELMLQLSCLT